MIFIRRLGGYGTVCGGMLPILAGGASHILFEQTIHGLLAANADLLGNIPLEMVVFTSNSFIFSRRMPSR